MTWPTLTPDLLAETLRHIHERFDAHGIWHCLTYGTLLGAVREGDVIAWDYDWDLFVRPADARRILGLNAELAADGYAIRRIHTSARQLAVRPATQTWAWGCSLGVYFRGVKVSDLYLMELFADGILRRYDLENETYWCPHSSFPHHFVETLERASLRGVSYPIPRDAEKFIAGVYGEDWRVPYRAARQGGTLREGVTDYGDRYEPKLAAEAAWCEARGWDRSRYRHEHHWPRDVRAAGPLGPTPRTEDSSRALWWRTRQELLTHY